MSAITPNAIGVLAIDLLAELRDVLDRREELARLDSDLSARKADIERQLAKFHESTGLPSFSGAGMSVTFNDSAMRAKYDPEHWPGIVRWAIETGNDHIVQRRLTDAKVISLIEEGVPLPEGLTVETYTKISTRRK